MKPCFERKNNEIFDSGDNPFFNLQMQQLSASGYIRGIITQSAFEAFFRIQRWKAPDGGLEKLSVRHLIITKPNLLEIPLLVPLRQNRINYK